MGGLKVWSQEAVVPVISMEEALKLGVEGIVTKLGDESEAGLDSAAYFYATAKRLQTEQALGAKDLRLGFFVAAAPFAARVQNGRKLCRTAVRK